MKIAFAYHLGQLHEITGTVEVLHGEATLLPEGWEIGDDGAPHNTEYAGETDVDWNSQRPVLNEHGEITYADEYGNRFPAAALVLEECDEDHAPLDPEGALARAKAALEAAAARPRPPRVFGVVYEECDGVTVRTFDSRRERDNNVIVFIQIALRMADDWNPTIAEALAAWDDASPGSSRLPSGDGFTMFEH